MGIKEERRDESGNRKNLDLAKFMVKDLGKYAKKTKNIALPIKYLNPTYAIRTTPANSSDAELCHRLAHTGTDRHRLADTGTDRQSPGRHLQRRADTGSNYWQTPPQLSRN